MSKILEHVSGIIRPCPLCWPANLMWDPDELSVTCEHNESACDTMIDPKPNIDLDIPLIAKEWDERAHPFDAYYFGFNSTGVNCVDNILKAIAWAGKSYHHTEMWSNDDYGKSCVELIQREANEAARAYENKNDDDVGRAAHCIELLDLLISNVQKREAILHECPHANIMDDAEYYNTVSKIGGACGEIVRLVR